MKGRGQVTMFKIIGGLILAIILVFWFVNFIGLNQGGEGERGWEGKEGFNWTECKDIPAATCEEYCNEIGKDCAEKCYAGEASSIGGWTAKDCETKIGMFRDCGEGLLYAKGRCCCGQPPNTWYKDEDGDGYYPEGGTQQSESDPGEDWVESVKYGDCDDSDPSVNPDADEICDNGKDDDCNGYIDSNDPACGYSWTNCTSIDQTSATNCNEYCESEFSASCAAKCGEPHAAVISGKSDCSTGTSESCSKSFFRRFFECCCGS